MSPEPALGGEHTTGRLGGRHVGRVGYGARQLVQSGGSGRDNGLSVLRRAIELGGDHIDTADFYGAGVVNDLIRAALHPYPEGLAIVSKVGVAHHEELGLVPAQKPEELRAGVEANLRRLGVERLAAVNLRRVDTGPRLLATGDQQVDLDTQLAELVALRDEGKIGGIGLSNVNLVQLRGALPAGIVCVQNVYNLLEREYEPVFEECRQHDLAWVPFFPLGSPASPTRVADHPAVIRVASALGASATQVGLAWLLAHDPRVLLIPGTLNAAHLEQNVAAAQIELDAESMSTLDAVAEAPAHPGAEAFAEH